MVLGWIWVMAFSDHQIKCGKDDEKLYASKSHIFDREFDAKAWRRLWNQSRGSKTSKKS